ncbi:MAG: ATP-dependent DNA helicase RecG [Clostridiales bacterium]|nr:ATP-dependent DNA helicase RecG [Clostridiales bacterium]
MSESILNKSIEIIKGIGAIRLKQFRVLGIRNIGDLITYYPRAYEDRTVIKKISDLIEGDNCSFIGTVSSFERDVRIRKMALYKVKVKDNTSQITLVFFNQHYIRNVFFVGKTFVFYGKVEKKRGMIVVENPSFTEYSKNKLNDIACIVPVYSSTYGLSQNVIRSTVEKVLSKSIASVEEFMPKSLRDELGLVPIDYAIKNIHMPKTREYFVKARKRLVFDEFFLLQLALFSIKRDNDIKNNDMKMDIKDECKEFITNLPFNLTNAQKRTIREVLSNMKSDKMMNRLIQGDVGCGKTIVAIIALLNVVKNGYQGIMLAPTEILAKQHYETLTNMLSPLGVEVGLVVGRMKKREKRRIQDRVMVGQVDIVVGTHAILQEDIVFDKVGLVITDEQHRFGVQQRATLGKKGGTPHVLAMSATPIPRTLSLILYGDLDISLIDELPPERKTVKTLVISDDKRERMNNFIREKVKEGRQVYIVCPLVDDSEKQDLESAKGLSKRLMEHDFRDLSIALIHGKMRANEKSEIMQRFKDGDIDILVSTTVIEVGVNVPNASIMVIENAERFGLSTLHQLRGRVGRGDKEAFCVLITQNGSCDNKKRMDIMKETSDGFVVAQKDLELRGIGDFFGTRQHGLPDLKIADIYKDIEILKKAQIVAQKIMDQGSVMDKYPKLMEEVQKRFLRKLNEGIILN